MVGSIISGAGGMASGLINSTTNAIAMGLNHSMQESQNKQNQYNWQRMFDYQVELNNTLMRREDTAVQRRAADLAAAGINPMLAGLGGASATPGGIINPLVQEAPQLNYNPEPMKQVGEAFQELGRLKEAEETQKNEIEAQLELQRRQINASNLADDKKYKADRQIEELQSLHRIIEARINAKDTAEQNKLDRDLQWKIATHKALRELFTNSEVPFLDNIWKELINNSPEDLIIDGKLNFEALKREWDRVWNEKNPEKIETNKVKQPKPGEDEKGKFHYEYRKGRYNKVYD